MEYPALVANFSNPSAAYRPMLFWLWNGDLTREGIAAQLADFAAKGAGGVFVHPMGESFRLGDFVQGMKPAYLSDEYFALVRYAAECARAEGLYLWLYDEGGWPSGTAQGRVTEGHPELRGKRLHAIRLDCGQPREWEGELVAAVGLPEMGVPVPLDPRELAQGLCPYNTAIAFVLRPDGFPVDILSCDAVRRFIEMTHERYAQTMGDFFGTTIPGIFTDETPLGGATGGAAIPWTRQLMQDLTERMGRDARIYLPLLFGPEAVGPQVLSRYSEHEFLATRCDYYDCLTARFSEAYWRQITAWCEAHGLIHTGHVGGEDNLPDHLSFGHFFRTAGQLHAPGVDAIWRQIFPGKSNFPFPRLAASAAKRSPLTRSDDWHDLVITETNAVYGAGLTYEQARWVADYQFQGGVNLYGQMACYYTTEGGRLYGTMSHFGHGNPLWPYYRGYADYLARLSLLMRNSAEHAPVALYYPVEALWTREGTAKAWEALQAAALTLGDMQVGFDFIDADLLKQICGAEVGGKGWNLSYAAIIVPAPLAISASALEDLAEYAEAGGRLIMLGHWPTQPAEMQGLEQFERALQRLQQMALAPTELDDLEQALQGTRLHDPWLKLLDPLPDLLLCSRELDGGRCYLLTNNSGNTLEPFFGFHPDQRMILEAWDLRDGERSRLAEGAPSDAQEISLLLPPWGSQVLIARPAGADEPPVANEAGTPQSRELLRWLAAPGHRSSRVPHADVLVEFQSADEARVARQYVVREGTVALVPEDDLPRPFPGLPVPLKLWEEWPLLDFSGEVEYVFHFTVAAEFADQPLLLDLGQVHWAARAQLNGLILGEVLWSPYVFDLTGQVVPGDNELRVTVANTLANQLCSEDVVEEARERGWLNTYYQRALPMMREDLRGGLVGAVRIILARVHRD